MREIKFRAWQKKSKRFIEWEGMYELARTNDNDIGVHIAAGDQCYAMPDEIVLEQYTGLKDKNGREIYEGDIVRLDSWKPSDMQIAFIEGAFCLASLEDGEFVGDIHYIHHGDREQAIVIGNIHENPELLTAK